MRIRVHSTDACKRMDTGVQGPQRGERQQNTNTNTLTLTSMSGHRTKLTSSKSSFVESICSTANICRAHASHHHSRRAWVRAKAHPRSRAPTHLVKARYAKESISSHHFPHGFTPLDDVVAGATFDDGKLILCSHALQEQPQRGSWVCYQHSHVGVEVTLTCGRVGMWEPTRAAATVQGKEWDTAKVRARDTPTTLFFMAFPV
jgi:hypothetical protein